MTKPTDEGAAVAPHELAGLEAAAEGLDPPKPEAEVMPPEQDKVHMSARQAVQMVLGPACAILMPNWKISGEEVALLSEAYAAVLDKYFPDGIPMGAEMGAVVVTLAVFAPRVASGVPRAGEVKKPQPNEAGADAAR